MKGSKLGIRLLYYFGGFFVMTIGIALSVKSNLGVSPVSSIPYTMTCVWGIEMGVATVIFHVILVILQMLLMRRRFEFKNLLQVPVGMVFGAFTTTCNTLAAMFPSTDNLIIRSPAWAQRLCSPVYLQSPPRPRAGSRASRRHFRRRR